MRLNEIADNAGARKARMRVGRGIGSGKGKTAGRGVKGQKSRTGVAIKGFEGGQMPLYRRIPKRGFNNAMHTVEYIPVNLQALNVFENGAKVDEAGLRSLGLANGRLPRIKILGSGELTKKLTVTAHAFSASARTKIEAKGGTCEVIPAKVHPGRKA